MLNWLENAVFYQLYPISFYDSNGDGKGDLQGILQKMDYLQDLGVTCVWLNPVYKSPFKDGGYDIADYMQIDKRFGTMEDLQQVIDGFHTREVPHSKVLKAQNTEIDGATVTLKPQSFAILEN